MLYSCQFQREESNFRTTLLCDAGQFHWFFPFLMCPKASPPPHHPQWDFICILFAAEGFPLLYFKNPPGSIQANCFDEPLDWRSGAVEQLRKQAASWQIPTAERLFHVLFLSHLLLLDCAPYSSLSEFQLKRIWKMNSGMAYPLMEISFLFLPFYASNAPMCIHKTLYVIMCMTV